jgi:predicted dienelactone hydrolase
MIRPLRTLVLAVGLTAAASWAGGARASQPEGRGSAEAGVSPQVIRGEWRDEARQRPVPYKVYLPAGPGPGPVVIFSHGLGGSREGTAYLLDYLARHGIVAVALQHPGTDESLLQGQGGADKKDVLAQLERGARDPRAAIARFGDIRFALDRLEAENRSGPMAGRLDLSRIGMSGHSYGALTTLVAIGQRIGSRGAAPFRDDRIDAAIVYSPNAPRNQDPEAALGDIRTPVLHFTGTEDRTPFDLEATAEGRQIPFRTITGADQFLVVFNGGDHMIFSGREQRAGTMTAGQQAQTEAIQRESLLFWQAYLLGDARALEALCGLRTRLGAIASAETRASRCQD